MDKSSVSSRTLHPGATPRLKPNRVFPVDYNVSDIGSLLNYILSALLSLQ